MPNNKAENNFQNSSLDDLIRTLSLRDETLSIAESCTGGLLSSKISSYAGVSKVFMGSVVSYSNHAKQILLDVPANLIKSVGAVSTPVALAMARGVREKLDSTWSISITGIAGPSGGTEQKPVGTVCFAICGPSFEETAIQYFSGTRAEIQNASAQFAVALLNQYLNH